MFCKFHKAIFHVVLAAALYAVSIPFSKLLLVEVPPTMLAAFLYIGAGIGMAVLGAVKKNRGEEPLQRRDIKYTISMEVLDIVAPVLLMLGLNIDNAHHKTDTKKQDDNLDAVVEKEIDSCTYWCCGIHPEDAINQPICKSVARNQGCCTIGATASS